MKRSGLVRWSLLLAALCLWATHAQAGRIVVSNDEWTLSYNNFSKDGADTTAFALNVASWLDRGGKNFLAYEHYWGLSFAMEGVMKGAGYSWEGVDSNNPPPAKTLAELLTYDAVFLGWRGVETQTLVDYVNAGGNVYLFGGTGSYGGAINEANLWNPFLNQFGLGFALTNYNQITGDVNTSSPHSIFSGVNSLYQEVGNDIVDLDPSDPRSQVLVTYNGHGLFAVYDSSLVPVPEPATMLLLGSGLIAIGGLRRKLKRK